MGSEESVEDTGRSPSQPRPLTLLIACGIVLATALLIVTGLAAGYLRQQTLEASGAGLSRLDAVLVEAGNRSFQRVEATLDGVASRIRSADLPRPDAISRVIDEVPLIPPAGRNAETSAEVTGLAVIGPAGAVLAHAGSWPSGDSNVAMSDYFVALRDYPGLDIAIGAPSTIDGKGSGVISLARKLRSVSGSFAGLVVAAVPIGDFAGLYRAVPSGDDAVVSLMRRDGKVLAQFSSDAARRPVGASVQAALAEGAQGVFVDDREGGNWSINAVQPLTDYPLAIVVSSRGAEALAGWSRQATMLGAFAICGILTIGLMIMLIGRQIHTHSVLAATRTEKIEVEHARLLAEAELLKKERLSMLGEFTATVANELRNPLNAIRNTLFTMREVATTSGLALDRPIARIQRSIARCDRIIGDLLEYVRAPELSHVPVIFDAWLRDVVQEHSLPPTVALDAKYGASGEIVRIDADRIRRVVINLIENAAQALGEMPPGGEPLTVALTTATVNGSLELAVADNGPGIAAENLSRIFEPLFSTKSFGAGLGLATVKQIVTQHGGTIEVDSRIGKGTRVLIRLPAEPALQAAA
jgi:signal transduction histidine kinase